MKSYPSKYVCVGLAGSSITDGLSLTGMVLYGNVDAGKLSGGTATNQYGNHLKS